MLRFLTDENVDAAIIDGLRLRRPLIDLVTALEVGLIQTPDPVILDWAATKQRIVSSHDRTTMTKFANLRLASGLEMPGLFIMQGEQVRSVIETILVIDEQSEMADWTTKTSYLPW